MVFLDIDSIGGYYIVVVQLGRFLKVSVRL